jgi:hypothetical protein
LKGRGLGLSDAIFYPHTLEKSLNLEGMIGVVHHPTATERHLVVEAPFVLMHGADPSNDQNLQSTSVACDERRVKMRFHRAPPKERRLHAIIEVFAGTAAAKSRWPPSWIRKCAESVLKRLPNNPK